MAAVPGGKAAESVFKQSPPLVPQRAQQRAGAGDSQHCSYRAEMISSYSFTKKIAPQTPVSPQKNLHACYSHHCHQALASALRAADKVQHATNAMQ